MSLRSDHYRPAILHSRKLSFVIVVLFVVVVITVGTYPIKRDQINENRHSSQTASATGTIATNTRTPMQT
jgi:hypothetical protein